MVDLEAGLTPEQEVMSDCSMDQMPTQVLERALTSLISIEMRSLRGGFKK